MGDGCSLGLILLCCDGVYGVAAGLVELESPHGLTWYDLSFDIDRIG